MNIATAVTRTLVASIPNTSCVITAFPVSKRDLECRRQLKDRIKKAIIKDNPDFAGVCMTLNIQVTAQHSVTDSKGTFSLGSVNEEAFDANFAL